MKILLVIWDDRLLSWQAAQHHMALGHRQTQLQREGQKYGRKFSDGERDGERKTQ